MIQNPKIEIIPALCPTEPFHLNYFVGDNVGAIAFISGAVLHVNGRLHNGDFGLNNVELWKKLVSQAVNNRMLATLIV